jgi:hypothetical protein
MSLSVQHPNGPFVPPDTVSPSDRARAIRAIAELPGLLNTALSGLTVGDLAATYRPGGWKLRQVMHHIADSHLNAFVRFKLALTEHVPTIKPYAESDWAETADGDHDDVSPSVQIIAGVHQRWHRLLVAMTETDWARCLIHPDSGVLQLDQLLSLYAWHGAHHVAQIAAYRRGRGDA